MRSRFRSTPRPGSSGANRPVELVRVRGTQRDAGAPRGELRPRSRRRGGRGRGRPAPKPAQTRSAFSFWSWLKRLFAPPPQAQRKLPAGAQPSDTEARVLEDFGRQFQITFVRPDLLKLALTHRSYLSVTGQSARESNERLEFLGDSVLGLVTSEFLYREHPTEHEGQLTKTKSLLVSKAILSRRALAMGLGKYVLMSRSESDSGGRQRLSILADAFESVLGAIYLDQGFEAARNFIMRWLLRDTREIVADKRHANYKSHLQEYVQSTFRTHPVYRIRSEMGPDHSKQFNVEVLVGRRVLGTGRGRNKKDAEQAAARDALAQAEGGPHADEPLRSARSAEAPRSSREAEAPRSGREQEPARRSRDAEPPRAGRGFEAERPARPAPEPPRSGGEVDDESDEGESRRRGRRGGRGRRGRYDEGAAPIASSERSNEPAPPAPPGLMTRTAPEQVESFIGGRTVERVGRPGWYDAPAPESPAAEEFEHESAPEPDFESPLQRAPERQVVEEVVTPVRFDDGQPAPPVSERTEDAALRQGEPQPQVPAGKPPSGEPVYGRKRARR